MNNKSRWSRLTAASAAVIAVSLPVWAVNARNQSEPVDGQDAKDKVYLEHADRLIRNFLTHDEAGEYQVLVGNVRMRKGGMTMYCDSAHFYDETNSFNAFSNVRMEQGDTLFVYGDELYYDGPEEMATLYADPGKFVRLINRDVTLKTYIFYYDLASNVGYYNNWGELTDKENRLESIEGEYYPDTKDAFFYHSVELKSLGNRDTMTLVTDSLTYNTDTHVARIMAPSVITTADGQIFSSSGVYNTVSGEANLYRRSTVTTPRGNSLTGDTLFYDKETAIGEAFGNICLVDSARQASLHGNYGYYNDNRDSAFVTGRALAKEYSRGDTLYIHGDTINAYVELPDSMRVTNVFHGVRMFRSDMSGICDSISVTEADSLMRMFRHPVLWTGERQVFGDVIYVHINDSVPDWARLPESGMMSEHIGEDCYNQLAGTDMTVWFNDSTVERLYVQGNVQMILFPMENDSTYNKFIYLESSFMDAYFDGQRPKKINFWTETTYDVTPLYLAKRGSYALAKFRDYSSLRPVSPEDVFNVTPEMMEVMNSVKVSEKSKRKRKIEEIKPVEPDVPDASEEINAVPTEEIPYEPDEDNKPDADEAVITDEPDTIDPENEDESPDDILNPEEKD